MKMFVDVPMVYLHREPVDFRKSINGLSIIVENDMNLFALSGTLFVFCNKKRECEACPWVQAQIVILG